MKKILGFAALSAGTMLAGTGVASAQAPPPATEQAPLPATPPPATPPPATQPPPARPHAVAPGESLSTISQAELGTSDRWLEIFALNRTAISDPDLIEVDQVVQIPLAPVDVPADLLASLVPAPAPTPVPVSSRQSSSRAVQSNSGGGAGGNLAAIRACESGGDYGQVSSNGLYRGAYQFDSQTWQAAGGSGDPAAASPAEQDARAGQLQGQRGSSPWPNCG